MNEMMWNGIKWARDNNVDELIHTHINSAFYATIF